jgi:hypothetical protein
LTHFWNHHWSDIRVLDWISRSKQIKRNIKGSVDIEKYAWHLQLEGAVAPPSNAASTLGSGVVKGQPTKAVCANPIHPMPDPIPVLFLPSHPWVKAGSKILDVKKTTKKESSSSEKYSSPDEGPDLLSGEEAAVVVEEAGVVVEQVAGVVVEQVALLVVEEQVAVDEAVVDLVVVRRTQPGWWWSPS